MPVRKRRRQARTIARTIAHLAGCVCQGRTIALRGGDHADAMRLHDALANQGLQVWYGGDGRALHLP